MRLWLVAFSCCIFFLPAIVYSIPVEHETLDIGAKRVSAGRSRNRKSLQNALSQRTGFIANGDESYAALNSDLVAERVADSRDTAETRSTTTSSEEPLSSPSRDDKSNASGQPSHPEAAGLTLQSFMSWLGFKPREGSAADDVEGIREGFGGNKETSLHATSGKNKRSSSKGEAALSEGSDALRDMADYLSEKDEQRLHGNDESPSLDDASDEMVGNTREDTRVSPDSTERKFLSGRGLDSKEVRSSVQELSNENGRAGDALADDDLQETVRSFAKLFAAIDRRLSKSSDREIRNHPSAGAAGVLETSASDMQRGESELGVTKRFRSAYARQPRKLAKAARRTSSERHSKGKARADGPSDIPVQVHETSMMRKNLKNVPQREGDFKYI